MNRSLIAPSVALVLNIASLCYTPQQIRALGAVAARESFHENAQEYMSKLKLNNSDGGFYGSI